LRRLAAAHDRISRHLISASTRSLEDTTMIERILLPLDGSPLSERALPYAVSLASATAARLILMHAAVPPTIPKALPFDVETFARQVRAGQTTVPATALTGIEIDAVTHDIFPDKVAEGISQTVAEQRADLVVMSTHGHSGLGRMLYGSVADQVLCESPVPVVLVPATCENVWPETGPHRILVSLDGSRFAEEVLEPVGTLAAAMQAELVLVGATGPLEHSFAESPAGTQAGFDAAIRETREYLEGVASRLRAAGLTVSVEAETGRAGPVIDGITRRRHVHLIAMATHGRSGIARMTLGSVASEVLQRTTVPLFLWRPTGVRHAPDRAATSAATSTPGG
jgi:nucleotide-binding universal stress UspA family protein